MSIDFIRELGYMAIASRLKRLTEKLLRGGSEVYRALRLNFEPRWFSLFFLLYTEDAPLSIVEIAQTLRVSHPAVIQTAMMLSRRGLIKSYQDDADRRKRLLVITPKGKTLAASLQPVWECFAAAANELFLESRANILETLERIEDSLEKEDIGARILKKIKARQLEAVEILDFRPEFRDRFKTLNEEWLKKYFQVEAADRKLLLHPEREILDKGGFVLFARLQGEIVGTAALLKTSPDGYELAKMAVTEPAQGKQAGRKLAEAAIAKARAQGGKTVWARTDNRLRAAASLYRKLGFHPAPTPAGGQHLYAREKTASYLKLDIA